MLEVMIIVVDSILSKVEIQMKMGSHRASPLLLPITNKLLMIQSGISYYYYYHPTTTHSVATTILTAGGPALTTIIMPLIAALL